mgnify:CR=1 FL=1
MDSHQHFTEMIEKVKEGSAEAQEQLFDEFEEFVRAVVRPRMSPGVRRVYESADVAQAVWASFFSDELGQRVFPSPGALRAFLRRTAMNKLSDFYRKREKGQRDGPKREGELEHPSQLIAQETTPSQVFMHAEEWDNFLDSQPKHYQAIFRLLRQGYTADEIADFTDLSARQIRRIVRRVESTFDRVDDVE